MSRIELLRERLNAIQRAAEREREISIEFQRRYCLAHNALVRIASVEASHPSPSDIARTALKRLADGELDDDP